MTEPKFKTGDWCFCEFVLQQVKETEGDRITEVSDSWCTHAGRDLSDRCFPLTLEIKRISDSVKYHSDAFHNLNHNSLNYPDLNRELIRRWVEMCECINNADKAKALYESLSEWSQEVQQKVKALKDVYVGDVPLYR